MADAERGKAGQCVCLFVDCRLNGNETCKPIGLKHRSDDKFENSAFVHRIDDVECIWRREKFQRLGTNAFGGEQRHAVLESDGRREPGWIDNTSAVFRTKTEEPENAEIILANARFSVANETNAPLPQIIEPANGIVNRAVG